MSARQKLATAGALVIVLLLGLAGTYKLGPKVYNRVRLRQLQGRHIYDEKLNAAQASQAFDKELIRANGEGKRLVVMLGGNWCSWCLALDDLMHQNADLRAYVEKHFVVLKLDSQSARALDESWGKPSRHGVPVLIFVDDKGAVRHVQETVSLELWKGRLLGHDPQRVLAVLQHWS
jgi:thioredoxin-related protein